MLLFLIIPFIIAGVKRYPVKRVFAVPDMYPFFAVNLIHIFFIANAYFQNYYFVRYAEYLQYANILSLLYPIIRRKLYNQAFTGTVLVLAGTALNRIVIYFNCGKMPVYPTLSALTQYYKEGSLSGNVDSLHILMSSSTKLNFLADYIDTGFCILSPGDVLIHAFGSIILYYTIKSLKETKPV